MAFMKNIVKRWKGLVSGNPVYINKKQWIRRGAALITGEGILFILTHICYEDIRFLLLLQLLLFPGAAAYKKREERRKRKQYEEGFREFLRSVMTSVQAGYSMENACLAAVSEISALYQEEENPTVKELRKIASGIRLHIPLEELFAVYAKETGHEDIYEFAVVLEITRSMGGDLVEVMRDAVRHLQQKMDTKEEIDVLLSEKKYEKNIMLFMPLGILCYMRLTNPRYMDCFYDTAAGHLFMTAMIGITVLCYFWTEKITETEI